MKIFYLTVLAILPFISCSQNRSSEHNVVADNHQVAFHDKFTELKFESDGKPCSALINNSFKDFKAKENFPLSLFITVNTLHQDKNGQPTTVETSAFQDLQANILRELKSSLKDYCFVGVTSMNGYRDILLYVKEDHTERATTILENLRKRQPRILDFTFETDPKWEAVESFYEAIK